MIKLIVPLLLFSFLAQVQEEQSLDSPIPRLKKTPIDTLHKIMEDSLEAEYDFFQPVASIALQKAYKSEDLQIKALTHKLIANWHGYNGTFSIDSTLYHSKKVLEYYRALGDSTKIAEALRTISIDYINGGDNEAALKAMLEALEIFERQNDQLGIAGIYKNLSSLYTITKEGEKILEYADRAVEILSKTDDYYTLSITYLNLIQGYTLLERYDEAIASANSCIEMVESRIPDQLGILLRAHSWRYDAFIKMEEYDLAYQDAAKAWTIAKDAVGEERAATYRLEVGNSLMLNGNSVDALPHLKAAVEAYEIKELENASEPYSIIAQCYQNLGQFENALKYQKKAAAINQNILETTIENLKSESIVKYETLKKDEEIAAQSLQLKQKTLIQLLVAAIAVVLAIMLFLLFNSFRKNKVTNLQLEKKNKENELLLKEIHHRVKNNLQTISSLLNLQSESITDNTAYDAVQESKNRVASMALIHQKLYQGENLAAIEMKDYFKTISHAVRESFGEKAKNIDLEIDMNEIELDVDTAVPIGLITNELLTNSLKYAFPNQEKGSIKISMTKTKDNLINLEISDNGKGTTNIEGSEGFGTLLIQLLTTQLGGSLKKTSENGTTVVLKFSEQEKSAA